MPWPVSVANFIKAVAFSQPCQGNEGNQTMKVGYEFFWQVAIQYAPSFCHHSRNGNYPCDFYVHFAVTDTCENPNAEHGFGLPTGSGAA